MNVPVFTILRQTQNGITRKAPHCTAIEQCIVSARLYLSARANEIARAVVAGGVVKCVGFFQIGIVRKRLLDVFQIGKANAGKAPQDALNCRCRIAVDGQREIRHAVDAKFPFGVQLGKFFL